jgi:hypothetical protein
MDNAANLLTNQATGSLSIRTVPYGERVTKFAFLWYCVSTVHTVSIIKASLLLHTHSHIQQFLPHGIHFVRTERPTVTKM